MRATTQDHSASAVESQLRRTVENFQTLLDLCHAAVISAGPDMRITSWNRGATELFGYTATEAIGRPVVDLVPGHLREQHLGGFLRHVEAGTAEPFGRTISTEGLRKDGSEVPVEVCVAVGRPGREQVFTAVVRDITEHHSVVEKLNDALQQLQFHVERMPLAYIVWDADLHAVEWNPAAESVFGYTRAEAIGRHAHDLIVPADAIPDVDAVWADLLRGDTSSHSINANVRKDGSRLTCEWFNTPLRDSKGRITGVASMAMDVSEREATEAQIRSAQKLESLGVMASGIAHDFNSSLMVILGNTSLLRSMKGLPRGAIEHLELIEEAGSRADDLIKHLLTYGRTGRHNPQPTDINLVIRDTLTFVRSSLGTRHELQLALAQCVPTILADRSQIGQILVNLCLNAKQAMNEGGIIRIATRRTTLTRPRAERCVPGRAAPGEYVEVLVSDTGCGMTKAIVAQIFEPFFTTKVDGHGLGLAAVLGILRHHRAHALIESQPGKGTRMRILFPIYDTATTAKPKRMESKGRPNTGAKRTSGRAKAPRAVVRKRISKG